MKTNVYTEIKKMQHWWPIFHQITHSTFCNIYI